MAVYVADDISWTGRDDPEDGAGARRLHHCVTPDAPRGLLAFACDAGVARNKGRIGAAEAPSAIRKSMANLSAPDDEFVFSDLGTVIVSEDSLEDGQRELASRAAAALQTLERILVLGGGHETAFGSYSGLRQRWPETRIGIVNFDAHLDMRALGPQGASSGTPFYQIRALDPERFDYLCLGIAEESNTLALRERARSWNVQTLSDKQLASDPTLAETQIAELFARNDLVYLTIDIDVLPHYAAPGVSAPAARGVPLAIIERLVEYILRQASEGKARLPLADIVEVCPRFDQQGVTARTAAYLVRKILSS